jgi:ketosteroid isomerase-like protein
MVTATIQTKVIAGNKKFMEAFARKDAAARAKLYTKGDQLLPSSSEVVAGRDAIQAFWRGALDMGLARAKLLPMEVKAHRNTAIEVGKHTLLAADGKVADVGTYVVIWKSVTSPLQRGRGNGTSTPPIGRRISDRR